MLQKPKVCIKNNPPYTITHDQIVAMGWPKNENCDDTQQNTCFKKIIQDPTPVYVWGTCQQLECETCNNTNCTCDECKICNKPFGMLNIGRHHCRECRRPICDKCSTLDTDTSAIRLCTTCIYKKINEGKVEDPLISKILECPSFVLKCKKDGGCNQKEKDGECTSIRGLKEHLEKIHTGKCTQDPEDWECTGADAAHTSRRRRASTGTTPFRLADARLVGVAGRGAGDTGGTGDTGGASHSRRHRHRHHRRHHLRRRSHSRSLSRRRSATTRKPRRVKKLSGRRGAHGRARK